MSMTSVIEAAVKVYRDAGGPVDLDNPDSYNVIEFRRSGCLAFDWICGNHSTKGGLPRGQIVEVYGPEAAGKTTIATVASIACQKYKTSNQVGCCDLEGKYNLDYGYELGLDKSKYTLYQPVGKNRGEAAGKTMIGWTAEEDCGLIVWDSFTATISKEENQGELTDANIGKRAMLQSRIIQSMLGNLTPSSATVIVVNQIRDNIGGYGAPTKSSGARALKFYAIIRVEVKSTEKIKDDDDVVGQIVQFKNVKNQASRPFLEEKIDMYFNQGYDNVKWCIEKALSLDVITKKGSKHSYGENQYSRAQLTEFFGSKKELNKLYELCVEKNNSIQAAKLKERLSKKKQQTTEDSDADF